MTFSPKIIVATVVLGFCLAVTAVSAQNSGGMTPASAGSSIGPMHSGMMHRFNGSMHTMAVTVTSVNTTTGIVEVTAGGMALRVYFPPASMAELKAGDKITLHMGYTK
jgi:hypothetical protein